MNIEQLTVLRTAAREKLLVRDGEKSKDGMNTTSWYVEERVVCRPDANPLGTR